MMSESELALLALNFSFWVFVLGFSFVLIFQGIETYHSFFPSKEKRLENFTTDDLLSELEKRRI